MSAKRFQQRVYCRPKLTPLEAKAVLEACSYYQDDTRNADVLRAMRKIAAELVRIGEAKVRR